MPSYPMTEILTLFHPSPLTEIHFDTGRLVFWLLTVEGALAFDQFAISGRSKVIWEVGCV